MAQVFLDAIESVSNYPTGIEILKYAAAHNITLQFKDSPYDNSWKITAKCSAGLYAAQSISHQTLTNLALADAFFMIQAAMMKAIDELVTALKQSDAYTAQLGESPAQSTAQLTKQWKNINYKETMVQASNGYAPIAAPAYPTQQAQPVSSTPEPTSMAELYSAPVMVDAGYEDQGTPLPSLTTSADKFEVNTVAGLPVQAAQSSIDSAEFKIYMDSLNKALGKVGINPTEFKAYTDAAPTNLDKAQLYISGGSKIFSAPLTYEMPTKLGVISSIDSEPLKKPK